MNPLQRSIRSFGAGLAALVLLLGVTVSLPGMAAFAQAPGKSVTPTTGITGAIAMGGTSTYTGVNPPCSYANAGSGAYAQTLCWINMDGITTEYEQTVFPSAAAPSTTCTTSGIITTTYTCRTSIKFESVLNDSPVYGDGVTDYGSWTYQGPAGSGSTNQNTARNSALTAFNATAHQTTLHNTMTGSTAVVYKVVGSPDKYYGPVTGFPVEFTLSDSPNALKFSAKVSISRRSGHSRGMHVESSSIPLGGWAGLGNNGIYTGIAGKPGIRMINNAPPLSEIRASLTNIELKKADGTKMYGFSVVVADAEVTDGPEWVKFSHSGGLGFRWLPNDPVAWAAAGAADNPANNAARRNAAVGNACGNTPVGQFPPGSDVTPAGVRECYGQNNVPNPEIGGLTGAAMLQISPSTTSTNFTVHQDMQGGGAGGVAFGLITSSAELTVEVVDRILGPTGAATTTNFSGDVYPARGGFGVADAEVAATGPTLNTKTSYDLRIPVETASNKMQFNFREIVPTGDSYFASYTPNWVCTKTNNQTKTTTPWPLNGTPASPRTTPPAIGDAWTDLGFGEKVKCTVTYIPPYLTLAKVVDNTNGGSAVAGDWTLAAQTALSKMSGTTGVKKPVAAGTYTLSESGGPDGYSMDTPPTCTIAKGDSKTCTLTNRSMTGAVEWNKVDDDTPANLVSGSAWTITGPSYPSGQVITDCTSGTCATSLDKDPVAGQFKLEDLKWGTYTVTESTVPSGYTGAANFTFVIDGDNAGDVEDLGNKVNTRSLGNATWTKVDEASNKLAGSVWTLTGQDQPTGGTEISDCTSAPCAVNPSGPYDTDPVAGQFKIENLAWGNYVLTEKTPPFGYVLDTTPRSFTVSSANVNVGSFTNVSVTSPDIPLTGGVGRDQITALGVLVTAFGLGAALFLRLRARRKEVA